MAASADVVDGAVKSNIHRFARVATIVGFQFLIGEVDWSSLFCLCQWLVPGGVVG